MIAPAPTRWRGYHFRSRTEARWAVLFDARGLRFEYERERYNLPAGSYLPDFWLPRLRAWAEVKGEAFTEHERQLCVELARYTDAPCLMLDGAPDFTEYEIVMPSGAVRRLALTLDIHEDAVKRARSARFEGGRPSAQGRHPN